MRSPNLLTLTLAILSFLTVVQSSNSTYRNPVITGWHSDASCIHSGEYFLCATSSFLYYPGLPIYASKDLVHWKLASHVWTRQSQVPNAGRNATWLNGGFFAPTLRYHSGEYYLINVYLWDTSFDGSLLGTIYKTRDPFDSSSWSEPVYFTSPDIDCDIFWDDDGKVYLHTAGIRQQEINLETGETTEPRYVWNGTGAKLPEGPHIYKKDGWYYLLIAEGGTELNHRSSIARSRSIHGPYDSNPANPVLTNGNTTEYFQTVGHADIFQDSRGKWWSMALATRSGPAWEVYPMGREAVLTPVTWNKGDWPVFSQIQGNMTGWTLPPSAYHIPGAGPFNGDPDNIDFPPNSRIPPHFLFNRYPSTSSFVVSPPGYPNHLQITPSPTNLTGVLDGSSPALSGKEGQSFVGRLQEHTLFTFSVDLLFDPRTPGQEAGITTFLTQANHISLSIAIPESLSTKQSGPQLRPEFRFSVETTGTINSTILSSTTTIPIPATWPRGPTRLQIHTLNATNFIFSACPAANPNARKIIGSASALVVSGGSGPFTGNVLGVYATCNGEVGEESACANGGEAYFSRWRYSGTAQQIGYSEWVPVAGANARTH